MRGKHLKVNREAFLEAKTTFFLPSCHVKLSFFTILVKKTFVIAIVFVESLGYSIGVEYDIPL